MKKETLTIDSSSTWVRLSHLLYVLFNTDVYVDKNRTFEYKMKYLKAWARGYLVLALILLLVLVYVLFVKHKYSELPASSIAWLLGFTVVTILLEYMHFWYAHIHYPTKYRKIEKNSIQQTDTEFSELRGMFTFIPYAILMFNLGSHIPISVFFNCLFCLLFIAFHFILRDRTCAERVIQHDKIKIHLKTLLPEYEKDDEFLLSYYFVHDTDKEKMKIAVVKKFVDGEKKKIDNWNLQVQRDLAIEESKKKEIEENKAIVLQDTLQIKKSLNI